jgi:hypothetical protein
MATTIKRRDGLPLRRGWAVSAVFSQFNERRFWSARNEQMRVMVEIALIVSIRKPRRMPQF